MRGSIYQLGMGVVMWAAGCLFAAVAAAQPGAIDLTGGWIVEPSEGNAGQVEYRTGPNGEPAMRLNYQFKTGSGFVIARKVIDRKLPANYAFTYTLSGSPARQTIEFKQIDDSMLNVWWVNTRNVELGTQQTRTHLKRHFEFAWGPMGGDIGGPRRFEKVHAIEIVVTSVTGGEGSIDVSKLMLEDRPDIPAWDGTGKFKVLIDGKEVPALTDGDIRTGVQVPMQTDGKNPGQFAQFELQFEQPYEIGGISVIGDHGEVQRFGGGITVRDGIATITGPMHVRWKARDHSARDSARINEIILHREAFSDDVTAGFRDIGRAVGRQDATRGLLPRPYAMNQQSFWTVMGEADGALDEALINEDGAIEVFRSGPSVEPFIFDEASGKLLTWADGSSEASLFEGTLPMPMIRRTHDGLELLIEAVVYQGTTFVRYTVTNTSKVKRQGALILALRPFQVNPPWQFLAVQGGVGTHKSVGIASDRLFTVNDQPRVQFSEAGTQRKGWFGTGEVMLGYGLGRPAPAVVDFSKAQSSRIGSFAHEVRFDLEAGARTMVYAELGLSRPVNPSASAEMAAKFDRVWKTAATEWTSKLNRVGLSFPPEGKWIEESVRANLAYILINKDGKGFQPGSRSYERSWIRDGSMTALSLLEFGVGEEVAPFVEWYAGYQFASGMVPCVVDGRGPDPVKEHDSHGQLIWAIWNVYAYTGDEEILRRQWPVVQKAVNYIQSQRATRMTEEWKSMTQMRQEPGKPAIPMKAFYGLMPESISHEGYSAKPMHSHWDNFFTILGLKRASEIARVLGYDADARAYDAMAREMRQNLIDSVRMTQQIFGIDYIPGCVELGDFDATSTTIAVNPCDEGGALPRAWMEATFERYWQNFVTRMNDTERTWKDYTPYEWRVVGTLVQLGQRQRAMQAAEWFAKDQYPKGWRHWGEIVWGNPRAGRFIGDMPHTWVGSDFLRSVRTMLVYERSGVEGSRNELVVFGGIPWSWVATGESATALGARGVSFEKFVTEYGVISASAKPDGAAVKVDVQFAPFTDGRGNRGDESGGFGGVVIDLLDAKSKRVTINGKVVGASDGDIVRADGSVVVREFPATVVIER